MTTIQPLDKLQQLLPDLFRATQTSGTPYLHLLLGPELPVLLPMESVHESLWIPTDHITPIPNMPAEVLGLMASRSRVFCAVNLAQLLEIKAEPLLRQQQQVVVVRTNFQTATSNGEQLLALVVHQIQGTLRFETEDLQHSIDNADARLRPFSIAYGRHMDQCLPVLDVVAISQLPVLQPY